MTEKISEDLLRRVAEALERLAPAKPSPLRLEAAEAFVWHAAPPQLEPVAKVNRVDIGLLKGIDLTRFGLAMPLVDELYAAPLDLWAREHGYTKIELNLVGL